MILYQFNCVLFHGFVNLFYYLPKRHNYVGLPTSDYIYGRNKKISIEDLVILYTNKIKTNKN